VADQVNAVAPEATPAPSPAESLAAEYDYTDILPSAVAQEPEPAPAAAPAQPAAIQHPRYLVNMAIDMGFTQEEIATTPSDTLGRMLQVIQSRQRLQPQQQQPQQQQQAVTAPPEPEEEIDLGDTSDFTPEVIALVKRAATAAVKAATKRIKPVAEQVDELRQLDQMRTHEQRNEKLDQLFTGLGADYSAHFGSGSGKQVKQNNPTAFRNRLEVVAALDVMRASRPGTDEEHMAKVVKLLFPVEAKGDTTAKQQEWQEGGVARPTNRKPAAEPPGPAKARKAVAEFLNNHPTVTASREGDKATKDDFPE
jgi:hypothetical protein